MFDSTSDLELLRQYRDTILSNITEWETYRDMLYNNFKETLQVLIDNPDIMIEVKDIIYANKDAVSEVIDGNEGVILNTDEIDKLRPHLDSLYESNIYIRQKPIDTVLKDAGE